MDDLMRKLAVLIIPVLMGSCKAGKEIQVEMVSVELIKIDTIYRYPAQEQILVWKCSNNVEYVSYVPLNRAHYLGERMAVMVKRWLMTVYPYVNKRR